MPKPPSNRFALLGDRGDFKSATSSRDKNSLAVAFSYRMIDSGSEHRQHS